MSNSVKVIDFGSSCFADQRIYSYIQSRFYRAPEIVLGIPYTFAIDIWSFGCILAEMYTGLPIFPAENEQELISCIAEVLGEPENEVLSISTRATKYFTNEGKIKPFANSRGRRRVPGTRSIRNILKGADAEFVYLVEECLKWNPKDRITPDIALQYPWLANPTNTKVHTRYCKISMEDIIKHTPQLKKFCSHRMKP